MWCNGVFVDYGVDVLSRYARSHQHPAAAVPAVQSILRGRLDTCLDGGLRRLGEERQGAFLAAQDWHGYDCGRIGLPHLGNLLIPIGQPCRVEGARWRE